MPDGDVRFLNALRVTRGHIQQQIDLVRKRAACFTSQRHADSAAAGSGFNAEHHVWTCAAGRNGHQNIALLDERFNLPRKDPVEAIIVARGGQNGRVCRQRQGGQARAVPMKPNNEFSGVVAKNIVFSPEGWYGGAAGPMEASAAKFFPAAMTGQLPVDKALSMFDAEAKKLLASPRPAK